MIGIVDIEAAGQGCIAVITFNAAAISRSDKIASASAQIKDFIEKNHPDRIVFDFGKVKFFSSQVLGMLLDVRAKIQTSNGEVVISAINPQLHKVFRITNLDKLFKFFADKKSAVEAVSIN